MKSVKLWSCSAGGVRSSDDCFPITCTATFACLEQWWLQDTETWLQRLDPKIIDPIKISWTIGLSQNQEVMTSQTTRDSPQMTTTFNKTRRKTKKSRWKSPRHWALSAIFRISPGNNTSIPTEYSKGPSRCLDLADIDQLLGDLAAILGRRKPRRFGASKLQVPGNIT